MKSKNLMITVSGTAGSGKSRLTLLLNNFLRENGFNVELDGGVDYKNQPEFDEIINKETTKLTLKETQLNRNLLQEINNK